MKRRLPPLNAVVAFEAAARLKSFKAAGASLLVTPSAISHQVRGLEDWLGAKLFERGIRNIRLTEAGERYVSEVTRLLDELEAVTRVERERVKQTYILRLQTTDSFANRWLVARLQKFQQDHPEITPQIITYDFLEDFRASEVDIGVLFGRGNWRNGAARLLLEETIFPVCSPELLKDLRCDSGIALSRCALICDDNLGASWENWFGAAKQEVQPDTVAAVRFGPRFNHSHLALKAAELGDGMALASKPLVLDALAEGKLVTPFDTELPTGYGYYLVRPQNGDLPECCGSFIDWLFSQVNVRPENHRPENHRP